MQLLDWLRDRLAPDPRPDPSVAILYECRHCGVTVDDDSNECPACGTTEIARFELPANTTPTDATDHA